MNRVPQSLGAFVTRIAGAAVAATLLTFNCTAATAAHALPFGPIKVLIGRNAASSEPPRAARKDTRARANALVEVGVEPGALCGDSKPEGEADGVDSSVTGVTIQNIRPGGIELPGGDARDDELRSKTPSAINMLGIVGAAPAKPVENPSFHWESAIRQSALFLAISHAFRFATEPSSRADLREPFWSDYFNCVKNLRGWGDGDEFLVNYIGHPMEGAVAGFIQIHNDPKGVRQEVGLNKAYWTSRLKAFGWAAAFSTQYEIGLVSEASLGNVGLRPGEKSNHPMGCVDLVVTPALGIAWLVGEDILDRYVIRRFESKVKNRLARAIVRSVLNPSRSFANMHRAQWFWHRDDRPLKATF